MADIDNFVDIHSPKAHDYFSTGHDTHAPIFQEERDEDDIYRGEPPPSPPLKTPRPPSVSSSSSSSSSSSNSSVFGGRLGAISTLVEHAITHWARAWASSSSLSSTSSSSASSIITTNKSYLSRKRRRSSFADIHNARSEREVAARIRARAEARQVPREFVLYNPNHPDSVPKSRSRPRAARDESGFIRTTSLPLILAELNIALKDNVRTRRAQDVTRFSASQPRSTAPDVTQPWQHHDYMMPECTVDVESRPKDIPRQRRGRKGKQREERPAHTPTGLGMSSGAELDKAWWLDVSSPTWEDMRAIGKLLHLHPLTLEDILLQDPREKLELFPKLGYYLVVFRAIESKKTRDRQRFLSTMTSLGTHPGLPDEGIVGEVNLYLVVFREGICSFHFGDIADHADTVKSKVLAMAESGTVTMSSDWIAHGIIDSIVDSYFPFLEDIEKEVLQIENLVFSDEYAHDVPIPEETPPRASTNTSETVMNLPDGFPEKDEEKSPAVLVSEKLAGRSARTKFALPVRRGLSLHRIKQLFHNLRYTILHMGRSNQAQPGFSHTPLFRMARTRRLVTSLARFLAAKSEVVAQIKKRLLTTGEAGLGNGTNDDRDVFVYMGDVQDHLLTLQQSLAHYERMLSQSHPTYLTQLRLNASKSKSGSDRALMILSIISIGVLCVQGVIGVNSMNVNIPHNDLEPGGRFYVFGIIISIAAVVLTLYGLVVWWWWAGAKGRRRLLK